MTPQLKSNTSNANETSHRLLAIDSTSVEMFVQMMSRGSGAGDASMGNGLAANNPPTACTFAVGRVNVTNAVADGSKGFSR